MKASELNIHLLYLNVCGLKSKLNIPELNELIKTCDIVTCVETIMGDLEVLTVDKFEAAKKS